MKIAIGLGQDTVEVHGLTLGVEKNFDRNEGMFRRLCLRWLPPRVKALQTFQVRVIAR
jgi:hypothetical protein